MRYSPNDSTGVVRRTSALITRACRIHPLLANHLVMEPKTDTNTHAFEKLKALVQADKTIPDELKKAVEEDFKKAPIGIANTRKFFEDKNAPPV